MLFTPRKTTSQPGGAGGGDWNFLCGAQCSLELYVCGAIHLTPKIKIKVKTKNQQ